MSPSMFYYNATQLEISFENGNFSAWTFRLNVKFVNVSAISIIGRGLQDGILINSPGKFGSNCLWFTIRSRWVYWSINVMSKTVLMKNVRLVTSSATQNYQWTRHIICISQRPSIYYLSLQGMYTYYLRSRKKYKLPTKEWDAKFTHPKDPVTVV